MPRKYGNLKGESLTGLCDFWHPSVHLDHKSESGCKYGDKCKFLNTEAGEQPSKKLKERWRKRNGGFVERDSSIWLCLMKAFRERRCCGKIENWDQITQSSSPNLDASRKISGKEWSIARNHSKVRISGAKSMGSQSRGKNLKTKSQNRSGTPAETPGNWQRMFTRKLGQCRHTSSTKPDGRHFVIDSGASVYMLSKKDLSSAELETLKRSRSSITVVTANW